MKRAHYLTTLAGLAAISTLTAQTHDTVVQFFNNNPGGFDRPSSEYNWAQATANNIATASPDVSQGNTGRSGVALAGERPLGSGFMFILPANTSEGPGASLFYTTHTGVNNAYQPDPQPDWWAESGTTWLNGLTIGDITGVSFRANSGSNSNFQAHVGLRIDGTGWVVSSVAHTLTTTFTIFDQGLDLGNDTWITGAFDGVNLDGDLSGNPTISLSGSELVTGFALYANTGSVVGNDARVRLDLYGMEIVPEPSTYALLFGVLVLIGVVVRRRVTR
jgi:hypothetical protein